MAGIERDAIALLVVRLTSAAPVKGRLCWHAWDESAGAEPDGLPEDVGRRAIWDEPFKRLPGDDDWPYFAAHVERLLFPPGNRRGGRWMCCPGDLHLDLASASGEVHRARVDLLERLTTPLRPGTTLGLIHLSLLPGDSPDPDILRWGQAIASPFRGVDGPEATLREGSHETVLAGRSLARALAGELFGDPDRSLERNLYTVLMATCPPGSEEDEACWRRALALHRTAPLPASSESEAERDERRTVRLGRATGLVLGHGAAFTLPGPITGTFARNLRSYWAESLVFGQVQQAGLEDFQHRLAAIGDPLKPDVEGLRRDWLSFRNVIWWSQLASTSGVPQNLLSRLREERGTERLFAELESDLATYSEHQHQVAEDRQAAALANLQIYGSGAVALGTLATILGLFDASGATLVLFVLASVAVAVTVSWTVRRQLRRPARPSAPD